MSRLVGHEVRRAGKSSGKLKRRCIHTGTNFTTMPGIFSRYTKEKYDRFQKWLNTKHGQTVYALFRKFSETYRDAGHDRCGANLVGNRIRWEMSVGEYVGYKVSNDFLPMLARQMVIDQPAYADFFT